jgi:hypothetical protein
MDALARRERSQERPVEGEHELFGFLTTEANAIVAPIHPKAMPVILTTPAEVNLWLAADTPDALALQRPLPDDALRIVAKGDKEDHPALPELLAMAGVGGFLPFQTVPGNGRTRRIADVANRQDGRRFRPHDLIRDMTSRRTV